VIEDVIGVRDLLSGGSKARNRVPIMAELRAGVRVHAERQRVITPERAEMPDVRRLRVQDRIEVGPEERRAVLGIPERVFIAINERRPPCPDFSGHDVKRIGRKQIVGIHRYHELTRCVLQAEPQATDDPEVILSAKDSHPRVSGALLDDAVDVRRDGAVNENHPFGKPMLLIEQALRGLAEEIRPGSRVESGQQRERRAARAVSERHCASDSVSCSPIGVRPYGCRGSELGEADHFTRGLIGRRPAEAERSREIALLGNQRTVCRSKRRTLDVAHGRVEIQARRCCKERRVDDTHAECVRGGAKPWAKPGERDVAARERSQRIPEEIRANTAVLNRDRADGMLLPHLREVAGITRGATAVRRVAPFPEPEIGTGAANA